MVLANESAMGFFPTDTKTLKKVLDAIIEFQKETVAVDPCAGKGEAIEFLKENYGCKTFAVELDEERAKEAHSRSIDKVLNADAIFGVRKNLQWAGILFLNPPYGTSATNERLELEFVDKWGLTVDRGGAMLLVINPSSADEKMAEKLQKQGYDPIISVFDPNNEDYKSYKQFFVLLVKRQNHFRASIEKFLRLFASPVDVDSLQIKRTVIASGKEPRYFKEIDVPRWKVENELKKSRLRKHFFDSIRTARFVSESIENPNDGQAAILIASGALDKRLKLANGDEVVLKGTTKKEKKEINEYDDDGNIKAVKLVDYYTTVIYGLNLTQGRFVKYE